MKRVAHLVINLNHGGAEQLVIRWVRNRLLKESGSTYVITLDEAGLMAEQLPEQNHFCLEAQRSRFPWDCAAVTRLRRWMKQHSIEVLHSHNLAAQQYGVLGTVLSDVVHVQTQHGANTHLLGMGNRLRSAALSRITDAMVAVSAGTRDSMAMYQFISPRKIQMIPNGVESFQKTDSQEVDRLRARFGLGGCFVFGTVGRLAAVKGWTRFLPEFARMIEQITRFEDPPPRLLLVGDGPEHGAILEQAEALGITDMIVLVGFQTNPHTWLALMDVFLLPSLSEGLSVALLEALENGVYSVVTDVGDCGQVVRSVGHGEVLPSETSGWCDQLLAIYRAVPTRRIGLLSASSSGRIYSQSHCLRSYEDLYASLTATQQTTSKH